MNGQRPFIVELPSVVRELIAIQIKDQDLVIASFEYSIMNAEKKVCRKGQFNGLTIQLRVSHLKDGKYIFTLTTQNRTPFSYEFVKKSKGTSEMIEFDFS